MLANETSSAPRADHDALQLRKRVRGLLIIPTILALVLSAIAVLGVRRTGQRQVQRINEQSELLYWVEKFHTEAEGLIGVFRRSYLANDEAWKQSFPAQYNKVKAAGNTVDSLLAQYALAEEAAQFHRVRAAGKKYVDSACSFLESRGHIPVEPARYPKLMEALDRDVVPARKLAQYEMEQLTSMIHRGYADVQASSLQTISRSTNLILGTIAIALIGIMYLSVHTSQQFVNLAGQIADTSANLKRSNEALDHFVSVAAHDLKEPLRMVTSYLALLKRKIMPRLAEDEKEFMNFAIDGGNRLSAMLTAMVNYSRLTRETVVRDDVSAHTAVINALDNLALAIRESEAVVTYGNLPTVVGDSAQLLQVFQNLIGNALKYRGADSPRIHISAKTGRNKCLFLISDNGLGIDKSQCERIFGMFQRLRQNNAPGTGIGLSICKKIVERHGGKIWVESKPGLGSTFFFTLRAAKVVAA